MARSPLREAAFIAVAFVFCLTLNGSKASRLPPLFHESPNARTIDFPRADEQVTYRLPNDTHPIHYTIELTTNVHTGERAFKGKVVIDIQVLVDTTKLVLHARQLKNIKATVNKQNDVANKKELEVATNEVYDFLTLTPKDTSVKFVKNELWTITIEYEGDLRLDNGGFYLSTFNDENNNKRYLATTQFESTDARHGFPCYDEPAKRATFTITIHHDPSYHAISNMPVDTTKSSSGTTTFETTKKMPTYLIAFIVSDFKHTEGELNALRQRVFSRAGTEHDQEFALVSGMLIVQRLADYYSIPFAFPKLDQVAVPDFAAGAMENWGLVTYREEYLLYNPHKSTVNTQTSVANIIAHEYTHQWFGNYVAIDWWEYLWLKEGFATLFSYVATDDAYPEWDIYQMFHTSEYQRALNADAVSNSRPMTYYVERPNQISSLYDSISYSKAGSVLGMFQHALTDKVFRRGLHNYLDTKKFDSAKETDLFNAIAIAAKEENYAVPAAIDVMMSSWTRQGGYPVLNVQRNYQDGSFTIKQNAFYNDDSIQTDNLWYVPVNYVKESHADFRNTEATHYLLATKELSVSDAKIDKDDWLILNKQSTGYYRINYDEKNWALISDGLVKHSYKVHPRNRAQLIDDAYRFSVSNRLKHDILLNLLGYLHSEDQYAPWSAANDVLVTFNRYLSGDVQYKHYQNYVAELVQNIYDKLGVNDVPGEQHLQKFTRSIAINLACMAGIKSCLQETNDKLVGLIKNGIEIEPNLQSQTYCNGLKQSTNDVFDFVYNKLMNSEDQAERRVLISSLGCSQSEEQISKFVSSSIDETNKLRAQERTTILNPAYSRGEVGLYASIKFLMVNWEKYASLTVATFGGAMPLNDDILRMSFYVVNEDQEKALLELVNEVKSSDKVNANLEERVKANIQANYDWLKANRGPVMGWLVNYYSLPQEDGSAALASSCVSILLALTLIAAKLF